MIDIRHGGTVGKIVLGLLTTGLFGEKTARKSLDFSDCLSTIWIIESEICTSRSVAGSWEERMNEL
jgi:hypothetical protein